MGITGLLPLLKSIQKPCNLKKYAGQTIGVDAYGWLHRGTVACAIDLALGRPTTKYVEFSMHRVRMLMHFGVIPFIVFDGDYLPSKAATEVERAKRRDESKRKGLELYRLNKPSQAHLELQKAVEVTPEMARQLIDELKKMGVQYIVAPYEADAQLVYLERKGIIQGILSEDSDLLVFGAKCLLTKLDQYGDCVGINRSDFAACREISLVGWSDAEFRRMAILSGCDYLASINRMGLKSAYRLVRRYKNIEKIIQMLQFDRQYHVPTGYLEKFYKAELTFLHQRVFCPLSNTVVMMTELGKEAQPEDFSFIGHEVEQDVAIGVAKGDLDPMTKQPIYVKKSTLSTPKTPWTNPRRNTIDSSFESKVGKSIDSFFKAKRTPLAELDPNSFTPSPTQQRLLQQANGTSWESSPAPSRPPILRTSMSMPSPTFRPALSTQSSQAVRAVGAALTGPTLSKRRRLCLEPEDDTGLGNATTSDSGRSRFFESNKPDLRASMKENKITKRRKQADFNIWSDDSVEDAMAELPILGEQPGPPEKGDSEVLGNEGQEKLEDCVRRDMPNEEKVGDKSPSSTASAGSILSETATNTPATSFTSSAPIVAQALDVHVTGEIKALCKNLSCQPESERMASQRREIQRAKTVNQPASAIQVPIKPLIQRKCSLTPLQRLGVGALNRSKSCTGLISNAVDRSAKNKDSLMGQTSCMTTQKPPALPVAYSMDPDAPVTRGSEDALIPSSDNSADDAASTSQVEEQPEPTVNLGKFAFKG